MRIVHLCLSCFYIDGYSYQENIIPYFNKKEGHDVLIIASTETYLSQNQLGYTTPRTYSNEYGIPVIRIEYMNILPHFIMRKLRIHNKIYKLLETFHPDVIMFHGLCGWELITVARYKKKFQKVRVYADSHEDKNNSARGFISRYILHGIYYRMILKAVLPYLEKILYVSLESEEFIRKVYGIPNKYMEFYPLGGYVYSDNKYIQKREEFRKRLNSSSGDIIIIQAGKLDSKKKVLESIRAFSKIKSTSMKLILIGSVDGEISEDFNSLLRKDPRVNYIGWKKSEELMGYLCAADVYLQPGSQSAIMQNALCLRCPVILDDVLSHQAYINDNGWLINRKMTLYHILNEIADNPNQLNIMAEKSLELARKMLDYRKLARKICS